MYWKNKVNNWKYKESCNHCNKGQSWWGMMYKALYMFYKVFKMVSNLNNIIIKFIIIVNYNIILSFDFLLIIIIYIYFFL